MMLLKLKGKWEKVTDSPVTWYVSISNETPDLVINMLHENWNKIRLNLLHNTLSHIDKTKQAEDSHKRLVFVLSGYNYLFVSSLIIKSGFYATWTHTQQVSVGTGLLCWTMQGQVCVILQWRLMTCGFCEVKWSTCFSPVLCKPWALCCFAE